ncbi:MAG TPA: hypothetical protein VIF09_26660 [Polyangiaceae bacterium]
MNRSGWGRAASLGVALAGFAALFACGSPAGQEQQASTSEAILGGAPVYKDILGSVQMWICPNGASSCCPPGMPTCTFAQSSSNGGCSGTMVADRWMLTAHHCLTVEETGYLGTAYPPGELLAWSADQATSAVGEAVFLDPYLDVGLVLLGSSVANASGAALTSPIYTGTSAGLQGAQIYCQGFGDNLTAGGGSGYGTLRSALMTVTTGGAGQLYMDQNAQGQLLYFGDSGTGCFLVSPGTMLPDPLVGVQSLLVEPGGGAPNFDRAVGADAFLAWARSTVNGEACAEYGATCGTVTDAFGKTASCGTCGAGDVCESGSCVCAPRVCRRPAVWNQANCDCEIPCHSAITCCIQAGGAWDGKRCE